MQVVLLEPEIPPNTGNVARLCAATNSGLHLIEPFGFRFDDRRLRRAGMDYWQQVTWRTWRDWPTFYAAHRDRGTFWFIESVGDRHYAQIRFRPSDYLVFGRESAGLPEALLEEHRERCLRIPMATGPARSLNLANSVAIVLYEALRQQNFPGER